MAACSLSVSEAHRIRLAHLFDSVAREAMLPRQPFGFLLPDDPGAGKTSMAGLFIKELTRGDFDRCLVVSPGSLAARFEGRFRHGVHQVEVSDLMRLLVKEIGSNSTRRRCFLGLAYTVPYKLSHADSRLPKEVTDSVRTEFSNRGRSGRDLGEARGASPSTPSARTLITAWIDDRRSRGRPPGAPENHVARGT